MQKKIYLILLWIFFGTIARLIPHPPNVTPLTNLSLFAGSQLSRPMAIIIILCSLILSDLGLHYLLHSPLFGSWTFFNYSGFLIITLLGSKLNQKFSTPRLLSYVLISSLGFWLWTNFGVWLSGFYGKNFNGLITCYLAALPFLKNQLLGDLGWMLIIFGSHKLILKNLIKPRYQNQITG